MTSYRQTNGSKPARGERLRTVLVVDDLPRALVAIERMLRLHGFDVITASDVQGGLSLLNTFACDAVIADLHLGDGPDGMTLLDAAARWHSRVVRILLTADPIGAEHAARNGATWIERDDEGSSGEMVRALRAALG